MIADSAPDTSAPVIGAFFLGAYLLGSVPFGLVMGKLKGVDIREHGSGNIGATNAMRVLGKPLGIACFALDVAKGALPVALAGALLGFASRETLSAADASVWIGLGMAAVTGHMFSVFIGFKGGKGVATGFGALLAIWPWVTLPALAAMAVWYATLRATRYVSIASCVAACAVPAGVLIAAAARGELADSWPFASATAALALLVVWKHRGNLARVRSGDEPRTGRQAS